MTFHAFGFIWDSLWFWHRVSLVRPTVLHVRGAVMKAGSKHCRAGRRSAPRGTCSVGILPLWIISLRQKNWRKHCCLISPSASVSRERSHFFFLFSGACTPFYCAWCSTAVNARCFQQDRQDNLTRMHNKIRLIPHKTDLPLKANLHIEPASEERFARWY